MKLINDVTFHEKPQPLPKSLFTAALNGEIDSILEPIARIQNFVLFEKNSVLIVYNWFESNDNKKLLQEVIRLIVVFVQSTHKCIRILLFPVDSNWTFN